LCAAFLSVGIFIHTHAKDLFAIVVVQKRISVVQRVVFFIVLFDIMEKLEVLVCWSFADRALNSDQTVEVFEGKMKFLLTKEICRHHYAAMCLNCS